MIATESSAISKPLFERKMHFASSLSRRTTNAAWLVNATSYDSPLRRVVSRRRRTHAS